MAGNAPKQKKTGSRARLTAKEQAAVDEQVQAIVESRQAADLPEPPPVTPTRAPTTVTRSTKATKTKTKVAKSDTGVDGVGPAPTDVADPNAPVPIGVPKDYRSTQPGAYYYDANDPEAALGGNRFGPGQADVANAFSWGGASKGLGVNPQGVDPRYLTGQAEIYLSQITGTDELMDLQARLKAAGFIPSRTKYSAGSWDDTTESALKNAMTAANFKGVTVNDVLDMSIDASGGGVADASGGGGGGGGGGGSTATLDPEQVRQAIDMTGKEVIGRNVDPTLREQIAAEINADYAAANAAGTASFDLDANIRRKIREKFGDEALGHDVLGQLDTFAGMMGVGGGFGSAPSYGRSNVGPATGAAPIGVPTGGF